MANKRALDELILHLCDGLASGILRLSPEVRSLWGKSDYGEQRSWLPLFVHMVDSAGVAGHLWDEWLPGSTRKMLARCLGRDRDFVRRFAVFLCAVHDIGKATPTFQAMPCGYSLQGVDVSLCWKPRDAGLPFDPGSYSRDIRHPVAGQAVIERILSEAHGIRPIDAQCVSSIVGCHHGTPPSSYAVQFARESSPTPMGFNHEQWLAVQDELFSLALALSDMTLGELVELVVSFIPAQVASVLSGLLIMCDWISSNADAFPLVSLGLPGNAWDYGMHDADRDTSQLGIDSGALKIFQFSERVQRGWESTALLPSWQELEPPTEGVDELYSSRFDLPNGARPRPVQRAALVAARDVGEPGLLIIEAPMGEGKTEAALAAAEVLAARTGAGGVCVALPTMATTDAMFGRVHTWLRHLGEGAGVNPGSVYLAHGKARLNEEFQGIARGAGRYVGVDQDAVDARGHEGIVVSDWMRGRKRGVLANFVVCTVDQVLMGALQMRHLALRQLSLANKVVIIDECHAYDMYMRQFLNDVLGWLGSWRVPVVLLSATLPTCQRDELMESYLKGREATWKRGEGPVRRGNRRLRSPFAVAEGSACVVKSSEHKPEAYPLLTYSDGAHKITKAVPASSRGGEAVVSMMDDGLDSLVSLLHEKLGDGGCAGVVCDTVGRAQEAAEVLVREFGGEHVSLSHARFIDLDRMENERRLRGLLGPEATLENGKRPSLHIAVGTQVLEQSLDIDFDLLVTDVAPVDLLFQRLGRCHRHARGLRPAPVRQACCYVRGISEWRDGIPRFDAWVTRVYQRASLFEALSVCGLRDANGAATLTLPADIARLVRLAYGSGAASGIPEAWMSTYEKAVCARAMAEEEKRRRARNGCLLKDVRGMLRNRETLTGWYEPLKLAGANDDERGPRAVRDTGESIEVMALCLRAGRVFLLPWVGDEGRGVGLGAELSLDEVPSGPVARLAAQSLVRLPLSLCPDDTRAELLVGALEEMDRPYVMTWQESPWLQGQLALLLEESAPEQLSCVLDLGGGGGRWEVSYARDVGLTVHRIQTTIVK